jgi:hypothetical protein
MKALPGLFLVFVSLAISLEAFAQPHCTGPNFSDDQIREIVRRERLVRTDIPPRTSAEYTDTIWRYNCFYRYTETRLPAGPHTSLIFLLNQYGVIVDVSASY